MDIDIYRIVDKDGTSFLHEEVCRSCAEAKKKDGFKIEFDNHLYRYLRIDDDISYYYDGDEECSEITCSLCCDHLVSEFDEILK